jgi:hypothetical protein
MVKRLTTTVVVTLDDNTFRTLPAGTIIPAELEHLVTNPRAFIDAEADETSTSTAGSAPAGDYTANTMAELKVLLQERELPQNGTKPELIERLIAFDAEREEPDQEGQAGDESEADEADETSTSTEETTS